MKINTFKMFKKKHSIQSDFPVSGFQPLNINEPIYPLFIPLEKNGLFAYSTRSMVKSEDLSKVEDLVERYYHKENMKEKEHLYDYGKYFVTINLTICVLFLLIV